MEPPPTEIFLEALHRVVSDNLEFVPPLESGGSMYIRPFVFGSGAQIGLWPAKETTFIILVNPVGEFYKGGMGSPVKALISRDLDRAAPFGTGHVKLGGNYATVFKSTVEAKKKGCVVNLFLDAGTRSYIDEFGTSNFAAVKVVKKASKAAEEGEGEEEVVYTTPKSRSILASVTNRSLAELAYRRFGWKVERRPIKYDELKNGGFSEVVACGTAVILTPVNEIIRELPLPATPESASEDPNASPSFEWDDLHKEAEKAISEAQTEEEWKKNTEVIKLGTQGFPHFTKLYKGYRALQTGELEGWEEFGWMWPAQGL
jgi:branched-chain amino acid aminotransferase